MSEEMDKKTSRTSILKRKSMNQSIIGNDSISDITTVKDMRRVSFASSNFVKPFAADPEKNTIWDNTYEEEVNHTDSTKSSEEHTNNNVSTLHNATLRDMELTCNKQFNHSVLETTALDMELTSNLSTHILSRTRTVPVLEKTNYDPRTMNFTCVSSSNKQNLEETVKQKIVIFEDSQTEIDKVDASFNIQSKTIMFEDNQTEMELTEVFSNIPMVTKFKSQPDASSNIQSKTIMEDTQMEMELTEAFSNIPMVSKFKSQPNASSNIQSKTIMFEDSQMEMEITDAFSNIPMVSKLKSQPPILKNYCKTTDSKKDNKSICVTFKEDPKDSSQIRDCEVQEKMKEQTTSTKATLPVQNSSDKPQQKSNFVDKKFRKRQNIEVANEKLLMSETQECADKKLTLIITSPEKIEQNKISHSSQLNAKSDKCSHNNSDHSLHTDVFLTAPKSASILKDLQMINTPGTSFAMILCDSPRAENEPGKPIFTTNPKKHYENLQDPEKVKSDTSAKNISKEPCVPLEMCMDNHQINESFAKILKSNENNSSILDKTTDILLDDSLCVLPKSENEKKSDLLEVTRLKTKIKSTRNDNKHLIKNNSPCMEDENSIEHSIVNEPLEVIKSQNNTYTLKRDNSAENSKLAESNMTVLLESSTSDSDYQNYTLRSNTLIDDMASSQTVFYNESISEDLIKRLVDTEKRVKQLLEDFKLPKIEIIDLEELEQLEKKYGDSSTSADGMLSSNSGDNDCVEDSDIEVPMGLEERVREKEKSSKKYWQFFKCEKDCYCFYTFCKAVPFKVYVDTNSGIVRDIETFHNLIENAIPTSIYYARYMQDKLKKEHLLPALGTSFDILTLLDYVVMCMEEINTFENEYKKLEIEFGQSHKFGMDSDLSINISVLNVELIIWWTITVELSLHNLGEITSVKARHNELINEPVDEEEIKKIAKDTTGPNYLRNFIKNVDEYVKKEGSKILMRRNEYYRKKFNFI